MAEITVNQNATECVRTVSNIGGSIVKNICSGTETPVPWGTLDWALFYGLGGIGLVVVLMFLGMGLSILSDVFGRW
jgi:hypothetical protein